MPDSEKKDRVGRRADVIDTAKLGLNKSAQRDESSLYGDEADIPARRKKKAGVKHKKASSQSKKSGVSKAEFPKVTPKRKKKSRKPRRAYQSIFELMSATGSDSFFKPVRIFGREFRFWPLLLAAVIILLASGVMLNNNNLTVAEQKVTVVGLPEDLENYRIIVLSDMNAKRFGDSQSALLRTINSLKYDAIFCLGDMVGKSGNAQPFYDFLDGLRYPERVYFICGDSDPGPYVKTVRSITGTLPQLVLEDWILGGIERGAHFVDAPTLIQVRNANLWVSPASMLNLETTATLESWKNQTEQEEDGVISGISEDYATLPITSYRYQLAQKLYDAQRSMSALDVHIALSHEVPSDEFIYTSEEHDPDSERYLIAPELLLAGHYCGGVWRIPILGAFYVPDKLLPRAGWFPKQEDVAGLSNVGDTQVYITKGMSTNSAVPLMPFRLFNGPEISVVTLTSTLPENMLDAAN